MQGMSKVIDMTKNYEVAVVVRMYIPIEASDKNSARDRTVSLLDKTFPNLMYATDYNTIIELNEVTEVAK